MKPNEIFNELTLLMKQYPKLISLTPPALKNYETLRNLSESWKRKTNLPDLPTGIKHKYSKLISELENSESYATMSKDNHKLNYGDWFEDGKFIPGKAANDYLEVYPDVITEYSGVTHQFTGSFWLADAKPYILRNIAITDDSIGRNLLLEAYEAIVHRTMIVESNTLNKSLEEVMPMPQHTIPLKDGLLNLQTGDLKSHSPEYFYTSCLPRNYVKGQIPKAFLELLKTMFIQSLFVPP